MSGNPFTAADLPAVTLDVDVLVGRYPDRPGPTGGPAEVRETLRGNAVTRAAVASLRDMLPSRPREWLAAQDDARAKAVATLTRLVDAARAAGETPSSGPVVVDAATISGLLDITPRAARRLLHRLAELGLAWQMPPLPTTGPGRPRQPYRLLLEKLG